MKKVAYKYWPHTKQRSRSGQIRSPNQNVVASQIKVSCGTCFMGHLGRKIWWWHLFFKFDARKDQLQVKLGQIRSNLEIQNFLTRICLSFEDLSQDSKNVIYFYVRRLEMPKKHLKNVTSSPLPAFLAIEQPKKDVALKFCMHVVCLYLDHIHSGFWITWKLRVL